MSTSNGLQETIQTIAIIGAGISGLALALALRERNVPYHIYEQGSGYSEIGAGLLLNPAGVRALKASSSAAYESYLAVRSSPHPLRDDFFQTYTDGIHGCELTTDGGKGGVRRSLWIEQMAKHIPPNSITFNKRLKEVEESSGSVTLRFEDSSTASFVAVVGADGLRSKIRSHVLGLEHPATTPKFSHVVAYRSIMLREDARRVMDPALADVAHYRSGKGIGYVSYPITGGQHNNLAMFVPYPEDWQHYPRVSAKSSKRELLDRIQDDGFKELANLLADELDVWALYDLADHPPPLYAKGRLAFIGDAAHASTPNLGAGAGISIEDAAVLAELVKQVFDEASSDSKQLYDRLETAFAVFSDARTERGRWLVSTSRRLGVRNIGGFVDGKAWSWEDYERDTIESYHTVWRGQIDDMVASAKEDYRARTILN